MKNRLNGKSQDEIPDTNDEVIRGPDVKITYNEDGTVTETHTKQFQGCWCPPELFELTESRTITYKEAWLLMQIGSYVSHGNSPWGCYASNAYLAQKMGFKNVLSIKRMICHLKRLKLLRQVKFDGRKRYLDTKFSRARGGKKRGH